MVALCLRCRDVVEPAYKALLLKVDAMIERTAEANAKHSNLSRVETRYFLARRLLNHTKSPRLQAYAAKCRAASDDASKAYATAMMDNAFPKASAYFDLRSRGAATSSRKATIGRRRGGGAAAARYAPRRVRT